MAHSVQRGAGGWRERDDRCYRQGDKGALQDRGASKLPTLTYTRTSQIPVMAKFAEFPFHALR